MGDGDNWKYRLRLKMLDFMVATSGPLFRHLHKSNILVMIGVPNSVEDYEECLKQYKGTVDCIVTDRPALAKQYLERRPKPAPPMPAQSATAK